LIIYANGDSFVSGVELGDDILSNHPGYLPYFADESLKESNRKWISKTYDTTTDNGQERIQNQKAIMSLEYQRAFPNQLKSYLDCQVINHAQGGSSMNRIIRTSMVDLMELAKEDEPVIALIGTTCPSRSEISTPFNNLTDIDELGFTKTWEQISTTYKSSHQTGMLEKVIDYKIYHDKNYHQLVNAFLNIINLSNFCLLNRIKLFWICGYVDILNQVPIETELANSKDYVQLRNNLNFSYTIDMNKIASGSNIENVLCPSGHFSPEIHHIIAKRLGQVLS